MIYTVSVETFLDNPHIRPTDSNDGGPQNRHRSSGDALELGGRGGLTAIRHYLVQQMYICCTCILSNTVYSPVHVSAPIWPLPCQVWPLAGQLGILVARRVAKPDRG